jgi:hypothetical protein
VRLDEYQWSRNPRGLHNKAAPFRMNAERMNAARYGWCKMVAIGGEYMDDLPWLLASNITPIIRIFRHNFGAAPANPELIGLWRSYANQGVKWFEFYNEPNLGNEWPDGTIADFRNTQQIIAPLMDNWLAWAELIISWGCYPAFPALAEAYNPTADVGGWMQAMLRYLADTHFERFRTVMNNGLWVATHPYIYNHYYQERPDSPDPRDPDSQNGQEGGWRFEYPYDPISQSHRPGLTTVSGDVEFPRGDVIGVAGAGESFLLQAYELFGGGAIPVVGTEGGITPVPNAPGFASRVDERYPGVTWYSHAEATLAMFNWIATAAPPWMFGIALWKEDDYYEGAAGTVRAIERLVNTPPIFKSVPPLEALGNAGMIPLLTGPGPVHGSPDYHFLMLAPGFAPDWFFNGGAPYYDRFRPTLIDNPDYIAHLPNQRSLALTVLSMPDMAAILTDQIGKRWPNVKLDVIAVTSEERLAQILRRRARENTRFGSP